MSTIVQLEYAGDIAVITVDAPPVNALSHAVRSSLAARLVEANSRAETRATVIQCAGRTFFAGADISEFGKPMARPDLRDLIDQIEATDRPVIAAIHGNALGGGLELALGCHYRVAIASAKIGLPEVALGLIPGAGGTQRLPRIVGVEAALEIITSGKPVGAAAALTSGLLDQLIDGPLRAGAIGFAQGLVARGAPLRRVRDEPVRAVDPEVFETFAGRNAKAFRGMVAPAGAIEAIRAAATQPFEQGMQCERDIIHALFDTSQSRALRHLFFAERAVIKVPGLAAEQGPRPIASAGVLGAGTMGGGIAMALANAGVPVTLVDIDQNALDRGIAAITRTYEGSVSKGRLTPEDAASRIALIRPTTSFDALAEADLIIEAVFESMPLKKEIFARLDRLASHDTILASNTSFLDLDDIALATTRPERVVGLHFFSPANVMKLLEVVRGARTADGVIASAMALARRIGKTAVLSGVCDGFIANRAMRARSDQADALILAGVMPASVDRVMVEYGFAMGPFAMMDLVGLDVIGRDSTDTVMAELVSLGRLGQKQGGGYYDYDDQRRATPSPVAQRLIDDHALRHGMKRRDADDEAILARLLYPVVNEGAKILAEGIALRASDIDVALVTGYGWPTYTGGPMCWADETGLATIVAALDRMADEASEGLRPCPLLRDLANDGRKLSEFQNAAL